MFVCFTFAYSVKTWFRQSNLLYYTSEQLIGLYYKHMTILNDDSSIISEQSFQIIDDTIGVIYDRRMFIIQATVSLIGLVQQIIF